MTAKNLLSLLLVLLVQQAWLPAVNPEPKNRALLVNDALNQGKVDDRSMSAEDAVSPSSRPFSGGIFKVKPRSASGMKATSPTLLQ
jgi:hypothetical protein